MANRSHTTLPRLMDLIESQAMVGQFWFGYYVSSPEILNVNPIKVTNKYLKIWILLVVSECCYLTYMVRILFFNMKVIHTLNHQHPPPSEPWSRGNSPSHLFGMVKEVTNSKGYQKWSNMIHEHELNNLEPFQFPFDVFQFLWWFLFDRMNVQKLRKRLESFLKPSWLGR